MTGVWLIICITVSAMVIAYLGDILGKRIGKKRISLFGLRPRTTAMVITILTGALISVATFGILISLSIPIRLMLFKTEEMQRERITLQNEIKSLRSDLTQLSDNMQSLQKEKQEVTDDSNELKAQADALSKEIIDSQYRVDDLAKNKRNLENKISELENELSGSQTELVKFKKDLNDTIAAKNLVSSKINTMQGDLEKLEREKTDKEKQIKDLSDKIKGLNTKISRIQSEEILIVEGQRLYGFTIPNNLLIKDIYPRIIQSFDDFDNDPENVDRMKIDRPSSQVIYKAIEEIESSKAAESIILVIATRNCLAGETIPVELKVLDQYIVFLKGTVVVEKRLDQKLNLLEARDLASSMLSDGENKAFGMGLLRDPFRLVTRFKAASLNDIAQKIVKHKRPMKIKIVAKTDITRGKYLDESTLEFRIEDTV